MSDEQERDAAVIARSAQRHADLRALTTLNCVRIEETALLIRVANAGADLIRVQHLTIDRLTAERDQARTKLAKLRSVIWSAYADLHSHLFTTVPVDAPNKMVEAYETLKAAYELSRAALESEVGE